MAFLRKKAERASQKKRPKRKVGCFVHETTPKSNRKSGLIPGEIKRSTDFAFEGDDYAQQGRTSTLLRLVLLLFVILLLIGSLPAWPYSADWGITRGGLGLVMLLVLAIVDRV
jgi:uncharacterized protein DUF3309